MPIGSDPALLEGVIAEGKKHARINFFLRTAEHMAELIAPWRLTVSKPIQDWLEEREKVQLPPPILGAEGGPFAPLILAGAFAER
jgi:hypothetical protein